ncbi:hypothetical protein FRB94_006122 [Tulasnella sp. JGI-2019a]|nr:hypothetical protein FRB93_006619 [Tulasnella sp. JGI-2019a]KAG8999523.1 hypothetical protein FRB94_006122 [Tulasnella sp. JGI-2019a]
MDLQRCHSALETRKSFPSLRRLSLTSCQPGISLFLRRLSSLAELTDIEVSDELCEGDGVEDVGRVTEFFQVVRGCGRLESLAIRITGSDEQDSHSDPLPVAVLEPLRSCSLLKSLFIELVWAFHIDDTDLVTLLQHLPRLIHFKLEVVTPLTHRPSLSLQALAIFTTLCPKIQTINIAVDASRSTAQEMVYYPTRLELIDVQHSYIEDSVAVAAFLSWLPASRALEVRYRNVGDKLSEEWEKVRGTLQLRVV